MKVRELIERLQRCDPELPVKLRADRGDHFYLADVQSVGTDNAPRPRVLISDKDDSNLLLPR